jgi:ketosteroid isomerase-like protein
MVAAINDRDLDAVLQLADPEIEVVARRSAFEGPFSGHAGLERMVRDLWELADDFEIVLEEVFEVEGRVAALGRQHGTARASGAPFDGEFAGVVALKRGRVVAARLYTSREEARDAVGRPDLR